MTAPASALPAWRSLLFVPAISERFVESALRQPADALQIDLEDSVPPDLKDEARGRVAAIADRFEQAGRDAVVRVNRPWRLLVRDLEASVRASVRAITLPKVPDASFVRQVAEVVDELEAQAGIARGHTRLIAMIEDAQGLTAIDAIAAAHPRLCGLIVGAEDLAASMGMAVCDDALYVPNVRAVAAARAAGIVPIGFVGSVAEYADEEAFRARIERARRLGFEAAFCVHPKQVPIVNAGFSPGEAELRDARELIEAFDRESAAGRGAFAFRGKMVDLPVVLRARALLERARRLGLEGRACGAAQAGRAASEPVPR